MRKIQDVLRLSFAEGLSPRQVARSLGLSRITVRRYVERARLMGLSWPLPEGMDERALEERLFTTVPPPMREWFDEMRIGGDGAIEIRARASYFPIVAAAVGGSKDAALWALLGSNH